MAPRVPEKPKKDSSKVKDNNVKQRDSYYAGQSKFNEDGSLAFGPDVQAKTETKEVIAYTISANKEDQPGDEIDNTAGISFVVQRKLLFVCAIAKDSVFKSTKLEVGDRVLSINDCNFRAFADANFASKMVAKATNAVTLVVEKGVEGFTPLANSDEVLADHRNKTPTRRRRSRDGKRSTSASRSSSGSDAKPLRRMLKKSDVKAEVSSDVESTDSLSGASFDDEDDIVAELGLPLGRSNYKEVVIAAPKAFSAQEVGVAFSSKKKYIVVKTIEPTSIFAKTSLEPGDIILEINDVDFRGVSDKLEAMKTCRKTKETVTMLVLKEDAKFKKQEFNLDASSSNLEWQ